MEKDRAIAVADFDEERCGHGGYTEDGGVADVGLEVFVKGNFHALLAGFNVIGLGNADAPVMIAVVAHEIGDGSAGDSGGKEIRYVRGEIGGIKAAPGVAHDADFFRVDDTHLDDALRGGGDAIGDGNAGVAGLEKDVRLEDEVAVGVHGANVVIVAFGGRAVAVEIVGKLLVHVDDHGIFFGSIVARRVKERALQPFVVAVLVFDKLFAAPGVVVLERIRLSDGLGVL